MLFDNHLSIVLKRKTRQFDKGIQVSISKDNSWKTIKA